MKIQTFSIIAGTEACNARCPFCISKMTPSVNARLKDPPVNWRNFRIACRLAAMNAVTTVMFTGKGEPSLYPEQITSYLKALEEFEFPIIELQSNGILMADEPSIYSRHLQTWYDLGLTTIAISVVHHLPEKNRAVYTPHREKYIDLPGLIASLHECKFAVRLACIMVNGYISTPAALQELIAFAQHHQVEQISVRPVNRAVNSRNAAVTDWVSRHSLKPRQLRAITDYVAEKGVHLMTLTHGALVYDIGGQNICLTDSLTIDSKSDDLRQLIFCPDGHLRYDWQHKGAILL